jgi:choline dehydrogenase-like flavoprotein
MATRLKDTDVVIIGLGAAGGVAALPLAQAGIEVIGLEAGGAMTRRDFAPDELRNNVRSWPMLASQKTKQEAPTFRATAAQQAVQGGHPMMNAIGGTSLHYWAQHWRLNPWDFKVASETKAALRRLAHPERLDGRGLAIRLRGARALLRQDRIRGRCLGPGGQHQRCPRSERESLRGAAQARLPDAAAEMDSVSREDGGCREAARMASVPWPGRDQLAFVPEPFGLHVSRVLQLRAAATWTPRTRRP